MGNRNTESDQIGAALAAILQERRDEGVSGRVDKW